MKKRSNKDSYIKVRQTNQLNYLIAYLLVTDYRHGGLIQGLKLWRGQV